MIIIEIILYLVVTIYIFRFLYSLLTIPLDKLYMKKIARVKVNQYKNIYVLLPALREQKIVKNTIDWFANIKYPGKIEYIIITTEKEEFENVDKEITTREMVAKYIKVKKNKKIRHMHYPRTEGNKSSQLNYAVEEILKIEKDIENTYISVFDFDSKPDINTFINLNKVAILKSNPGVISQVPINFKNYVDLSKKTSNCLLLLSSLQQNLRSCGIEKMKLLICSLTDIKIAQYCMGACMHIKLKTLVENEKFPIFVDDLTLGYRLSIKGETFSYLPSENFVLIPNKLAHCFNQAVLIFKGVLTSFKEIKNAKGNTMGKIKVFLEGGFNTLEITLLPYIVLFYVIYSLVTWQFNILFWLLILINYLWSISSYINLKVLKITGDNKITSFLAILLSPIWFVFKTFGSFIYYKRYIFSIMFHKEIVYKKTER